MRKPTILLIAFVCLVSRSALAVVDTVPSDLQPGNQYRLIFITNGTTDATSTDINTYNNFVTNAALAVPQLFALNTTWKAIGSTDAINARDNTGTNPNVSTGVPIYQLNDTRFVNNNVDLWSINIVTPLTISETGATVSGGVWTGTDEHGFEYDNGGFGPILGLGDLNPPNGPILGTTNDVFAGWVVLGGEPNTNLHFLYGLSDILTVPVPEPGSIALMLIGTAGLLACRRAKLA